MKAIQSALIWAAIVLLVLLWLPLLALVRLVDWAPGHYLTGRTFRLLGAAITGINPTWRVTRTGRLPADPRRPFVVVANHQSSADIPLISRLPWDMKWVAKKALFDVPVVGWMMRLANDIPVDRGNPESRAAVLRRARRTLASRVSVMFMPEGTRSTDGRVRRFQDGSFRLAVETGVPVLPIAIDGTMEALPTHGWQFSGADVRLHVLDPVETAGLTEADVPALRERVRQSILATIAGWRGVLPETLDASPSGWAPAAQAEAEPHPGVGAVGVPAPGAGEEPSKSASEARQS